MQKNRATIGLRSKNRGLVYEGHHFNFRDAVDDAIKTRIDLSGIDLSRQDLRGINLDGIDLSEANFQGSDLTDANLSEAVFRNCDFSGTRLFESCFCYSDLHNCSFQEARFGLTDFSESKILKCAFKGFSTFSADLSKAYSLEGSFYSHENQKS